jgi:hypothetical protein
VHRIAAVLAATLLISLPQGVLSPAAADQAPVACNPYAGDCAVKVTSTGSPGTTTVSRTRTQADCVDRSALAATGNGAVPCSSSAGWWSNALQCYVQQMTPPPAPGDPLWQGHSTGGMYLCTTAFAPSTRPIWLPTPAAGGTTPAQLAQQALASLRIPKPVVLRSPAQDNSDNGLPYTWVNMWTWWWTTPAVWQPLSATARAGGVWATVTVLPSTMTITPGDGGAPVVCSGPGRAWTTADANDAPSSGGCGYRYRHVTPAGPLTATLTVDWTVTWQGSGGTSGTLPAMRTATSSTFVVQQIQVVNT